ncbi:YLR125W-like protein [Saccharomyces kudriavzevii IFO 1802]|nr:YLR125W-like protein [Saccharomyces kudriavzevii IFO 1802]
MERNQVSTKSSKNGIESESGDVANTTERDYLLVDEAATSLLRTVTNEREESSLSEEEDTDEDEKESYSSEEEDTDEAEEESTRAYAELIAVLKVKGIPLSVLDKPQSREWLEKYTGVYRSSWHNE